MALAAKKTSLFLLLLLAIISIFFVTPSNSAADSFVLSGCSQLKYTSGSPYEFNVNSILNSLVNSAMFTSYNNFTMPAGSTSQDTVYGLFQCRGDLNNGDCGRCVSKAVSQLGTLCLDSTGGALQLEGCFVKYDNTTFLGVEDKAVVVKKCAPGISSDLDALTRLDAVLRSLGASDGTYRPFRVGGSGDLRGVAQCVEDLSSNECQDCLSEAIVRLKTECRAAEWGDMYLAKCYARYSVGVDQSHYGIDTNNDDEEIKEKNGIDSKLLIGLIAAVALLTIVAVSFLLSKRRDPKVEERIGNLEKRIGNLEEHIQNVEKNVEERIGNVEKRIGTVEKKVEERIGNVEKRIGIVEKNVKELTGNVDKSFGSVEKRIGNIEERIGNIEKRIENIEKIIQFKLCRYPPCTHCTTKA